MTVQRLTALCVGLCFAAGQYGSWQVAAQVSAPARQVPTFQVDSAWPKLPNGWVTGNVTSVAVGRNDHVWLVHRSRMVPDAQKNQAAPPVLEFDQSGQFVRGWGGDGKGYDWPASEHGIFVDYKGNVWVTGSSPSGGSLTGVTDNMILKFSSEGKLLLQIGGRGKPGGNQDTMNLERAADVDVYEKTNEVFVADGYGNRRVIVFDADTGSFKRMWGAFGDPPDNLPPASPESPASRGQPERAGDGPRSFANPVHAIRVSRDGLVYVADRTNRRVQVFTVNGKYVNQLFVNRAQGPSAAGLALSPDKEQAYLYVADYGNSRLVVVNRMTLEIMSQFGSRSSKPGDFQGLHHLAVDSKGNLYTAEVAPGNRAQKFLLRR